jgi:DNA-binding transcriptional LysR family regulator
VQLFERTTRRVTLTDAGKLFLVEAHKVLDQVDRARSVAMRAHQGELGEIVVGVFPSAPLIPKLANFLSTFGRTFPNVRLTLREMSSSEAIEALKWNELEVAFIRHPGKLDLPPRFITEEIGWEPLVLLLRKDHHLARGDAEVPVAALASEPMVYFTPRRRFSLHNQLISLCQKAGFEPKIEQEANENGLLVSLVAAGIGVTILPQSICRLALPELCTRRLLGSDAGTYIWFAHPKEPRSRLVQSVRSTIAGILGAGAA